MARVTSTPHYANLYRKRWGPDGSLIESAAIAANSWSETVTRDDIRVSPKNNYGFRKPLPYYASRTLNRSPALVGLTGSYLSQMPDKITRFSISGLLADNYYSTCSASATQGLLPSSSLNRLHVDLLKRIGNQKFSMGQALLEANQSVSMIGKSARVLQRALLHASRKDWSGVAKILKVSAKTAGDLKGKDTASGWLAFHFGWAPVVQDLANAALFLGGHFDEGNPPLIFAKGFLNETKTTLSSSSFGIPFGGGSLTVGWRETQTFEEQLKCSLYYKADIGSLRELARYGLVGLSTPWAVLPSSYLVDWILPIGDVLAALDATVGLTFYAGSNTRFKKVVAKRKSTGITMSGGSAAFNKVTGTVDWVPSQVFNMTRSTYGSTPLPHPAYIKNPLDPWKAVTSIALLRQRIPV